MEYHCGEPVTQLGTLPSMAADRYGEKTAFVFVDGEQSFVEFERRTNRVAHVLTEHGVGPGERVGLYMPNGRQFPAAQFGAVRAGTVPVPLNLGMTPDTLEYVLRDAGVEVLIADAALADEAQVLAERAEVDRLFVPGADEQEQERDGGVCVVDYAAETAAAPDAFEPVTRDPDDVYIQLYTSGTTGRPKGVPLSHRAVLAGIENFSRALPVEADDTALLALPLFHLYANGLLGLFVYRGGSAVVHAEPEPAAMLSAIDDHEVTTLPAVPAVYAELEREYREERYDVSSLETALSAGAPLPEELARRIERVWGVRLVEAWGMTEVPAATLEPARGIGKGAGCVGPPLPGVELKLVDPESRETIVGPEAFEPVGDVGSSESTGEIAVRGPVVFDGYHGRTGGGESFDEEGWFYTGDVGRVDGDGFLWIVDRVDDMIVTGATNVYPTAVEDALHEHPDVAEAAVVAAPHEVKGKAPVAFVVTEPDTTPEEDALRSFALERLPAYAHPRRVFFVDALPKSAARKVQRYRLEARASERLDGPLEPSERQL